MTATALIRCPHPLLAACGREVLQVAPLAGECVSGYLHRLCVDTAGGWVLTINGQVVPREAWAETPVSPGDLLVLRALAEGGRGGGDGSDTKRTVLMLAVAAAAFYTGGAAAAAYGGWSTAAGALAGGLASSTTMIAGQLVVNRIAPLPLPKELGRVDGSATDTVSPTYQLTGARNRARPYQPMPLVFGDVRMVPDLDCQPYTSGYNEDFFLIADFHCGLTPVAISEIQIGGTQVTSLPGVDVWYSQPNGTIGGGLSYAADALEGGALADSGAWLVRTTPAGAYWFQVNFDVLAFRVAADGKLVGADIRIEAEYRRVGDAAWIGLNGGGYTFTLASRRALRLSWSPSGLSGVGPWEIRIRRATPAYTDGATTAEAVCTSILSWTRYEEDWDLRKTQTRFQIRAKASSQLNGQLDEVSCRATASCTRIDDLSWGVTSNPADWFYHFAIGRRTDSGRLVYGAGLDASRIDVAALQAWRVYCGKRGLRIDLVIDGATTVAEVLSTIARCGRASPTWATGKLGVVWDAANLPAVAMFTPVNIRAGSFRVEYASRQLADEVVVSYVDRDQHWTRQTVTVRAPGVTLPKASVQLELPGVTLRGIAQREAALALAANLYRNRRVTWETDWEGLVVSRGDVVTVSHDLTAWGYAGRLISGTATTLVLDRQVPAPAGTGYLMVVGPDGVMLTRPLVPWTGVSDTVTLLTPLPVVPGGSADRPALDWRWLYDTAPTPGRRLKVIEVEPVDERYVRITAVDDSPAYYASESGTFPALPAPPPPRLPVITRLRATETLVATGTGYAVSLAIAWDVMGAGYHTARIRITLGGTPIVTGAAVQYESRYEVMVPTSGTLTIEVTAYDGVGRTAPEGRATLMHVIAGKDAPPAAVTGAAATIEEHGVRLSWAAHPEPDVIAYRLRFGGTSWETAGGQVEVSATAYLYRVQQAGPRVAWIKALDSTGHESVSATRVDFTVSSPATPAVTATVIDNNVMLHWTDSRTMWPIDYYEVRRGASWAAGEVIGPVYAQFVTIFEQQAGAYTYWVAAKDTAGNWGAPAPVTAQVAQPPDFVLKLHHQSAWAGTLTSLALDGGALLGPLNTAETWETHFTARGWASPQAQVDAGYPDYWMPGQTTAAYEETIDYGALIGSATVTLTLTAQVLAGQSQVLASNFRYVRVRYDFTADGGGNDLVRLTGLNVRISVKQRTDSGNGTANASDGGGTVVAFNVPFIDVDSITVTPGGTAARYAVYDFADVPNPTSFKVLLYDAAGARVSGPFSWTARGI